VHLKSDLVGEVDFCGSGLVRRLQYLTLTFGLGGGGGLGLQCLAAAFIYFNDFCLDFLKLKIRTIG
jgi:hypothetical protein